MSLEKELSTFFQLLERKYAVNKADALKTYPSGIPIETWLQGETYIDCIRDELDEVSQEIKQNNSVYLEDELWDIFWDYINLLYCLEKQWMIDKQEVFKRCMNKFWERVDALEAWISWNEIKSKQKMTLKQEHNSRYND